MKVLSLQPCPEMGAGSNPAGCVAISGVRHAISLQGSRLTAAAGLHRAGRSLQALLAALQSETESTEWPQHSAFRGSKRADSKLFHRKPWALHQTTSGSHPVFMHWSLPPVQRLRPALLDSTFPSGQALDVWEQSHVKHVYWIHNFCPGDAKKHS